MNSIYEKEKKLNKALEKLNSINPQNLNLKEAISNLDQQKNQKPGHGSRTIFLVPRPFDFLGIA